MQYVVMIHSCILYYNATTLIYVQKKYNTLHIKDHYRFYRFGVPPPPPSFFILPHYQPIILTNTKPPTYAIILHTVSNTISLSLLFTTIKNDAAANQLSLLNHTISVNIHDTEYTLGFLFSLSIKSIPRGNYYIQLPLLDHHT